MKARNNFYQITVHPLQFLGASAYSWSIVSFSRSFIIRLPKELRGIHVSWVRAVEVFHYKPPTGMSTGLPWSCVEANLLEGLYFLVVSCHHFIYIIDREINPSESPHSWEYGICMCCARPSCLDKQFWCRGLVVTWCRLDTTHQIPGCEDSTPAGNHSSLIFFRKSGIIGVKDPIRAYAFLYYRVPICGNSGEVEESVDCYQRVSICTFDTLKLDS